MARPKASSTQLVLPWCNQGAEPTTCPEGSLVYNQTTEAPRVLKSTGWVDVGNNLPNVTNDAQLKRAANDFSSFTQKSSPTNSDLVLIEDAAASGVKKYVSIGTLPFGSSTAGSQPLWTVPASAGAIDDEFDSTTLNASWIVRQGFGGTKTPTSPVDALTSITGAGTAPKYSLHTNGRKSWLSIQTTSAAEEYVWWKSFTSSTNAFYWTRVSQVFSGNASPTAGFREYGIYLAASSASAPDASNYIYLGFLIHTGTWKVITDASTGGAAIGNASYTTTPLTPNFEYLGFWKHGTTYYPVAFTESGQSVWLKQGSAGYVLAWTPAWAGLFVGSDTISQQPYTITSFDFIREAAVPPLF